MSLSWAQLNSLPQGCLADEDADDQMAKHLATSGESDEASKASNAVSSETTVTGAGGSEQSCPFGERRATSGHLELAQRAMRPRPRAHRQSDSQYMHGRYYPSKLGKGKQAQQPLSQYRAQQQIKAKQAEIGLQRPVCPTERDLSRLYRTLQQDIARNESVDCSPSAQLAVHLSMQRDEVWRVRFQTVCAESDDHQAAREFYRVQSCVAREELEYSDERQERLLEKIKVLEAEIGKLRERIEQLELAYQVGLVTTEAQDQQRENGDQDGFVRFQERQRTDSIEVEVSNTRKDSLG